MPNPEYVEEFDLKEFVYVINKRRNIVLGTVFILFVLAGIVIFLMPKTYEVKATIQNGYINVPIITYAEAATLVRSRSFLNPIFEKLGMQIPQEYEIKKMIQPESIKDSNFFILKIRSGNNDLGYSLCREIVNAYLEYGNSIYYAQTNLIKNHLVQLESLIEKTRQSADKNASVKKESILPLAYPDDKVQMRDLLSQKLQLETQLATDKEFKLIDDPVKPKYPISFRKGLLIVSFFILSLIVGIFFAFFAESWGKTKKLGS